MVNSKFFLSYMFTVLSVMGCLNGAQLEKQTFVPKIATEKGQWAEINKDSDKRLFGANLIELTKEAYKKTPLGSFVKTVEDVLPSDWESVDCDEDPDIDITIFYRRARETESWEGYKIQGVGHDGSPKAKDLLLAKLNELLNKEGYWIEASDALEHILYKQKKAPFVDDESLAQKIFPDSELKMTGKAGEYTRYLYPPDHAPVQVKETIFGKPIIKKPQIDMVPQQKK